MQKNVPRTKGGTAEDCNMKSEKKYLLLFAIIIFAILGGCDEKKKTGSSTCAEDACSGHGTCDDTTGRAVCTCDEGYAGKDCGACAATHQDHDGDGVCLPSCAAVEYDCSGHGRCDDATGRAVCTCDAGYVPFVEAFCLPDGDGTSCESPALLDFSVSTVSGTTRGAGGSVQPACTDSSAEDRVYTFVLTGTRHLVFETEGFDTVLALRTVCNSPASEVACDDDSGPGHGSRIEGDFPAGTYYLIVDSYRDSGDFILHTSIRCVDGGLYNPATGGCVDDPCDPNPCTEELKHACIPAIDGTFSCGCDPGAVTDPENPGRCMPNPNPTGESCADPVALPSGEHTLSSSTVSAAGDAQGSCGGSGGDRVYAFTVTRRARFFASVQGFDAVLYLRSACTDSASEILCRDQEGTQSPEILSAELNPGTYFLFIDTFDTPGSFELTWRLHEDPCADEEAVCPGIPQCVPAADWSEFACECPEGTIAFEGDCVDDPCTPNPCQDPGHGRCQAQLPGAFTCSCETGYVEQNGACSPDPAAAEWVFLVYLNADNNLESDGLNDIGEMAAVGSTADVRILVLLDTDTENGGHARKMRIDAGNPVVLEDLGEVDMGDWRTLRDFGVWAIANHPARHYALVLWDHGDGWTKKSVKKNAAPALKSFSTDDHGSESGISIAGGDFASALMAMTREAGRKLDLVSFDACLMGMWEVAEAVQPFSRALAASSETMPSTGLPYSDILQGLTANPSWTGLDLARQMVTSYYRAGSDNSTYAASNLDALQTLESAVDAFALALLANPAFYSQVEQSRAQSQFFTYPEYIDLYDFASRILASAGAPPDAAQSAGDLLTAFNEVVVLARAQSSHPGSHGLSIFLPARHAGFPAEYQGAGANWSRRTSWDDFLADFCN